MRSWMAASVRFAVVVMMAAVLIYGPALAKFWTNRLTDRLAAANTAALRW